MAFQGYFRRAEVEAASGLLDEAIISYTRALQLDPHNPKLLEQIRNMTDTQKKKYRGNNICDHYIYSYIRGTCINKGST